MGTPHFAVPSLQKLAASEHHLTAVVTVSDKQAGRGRKVRFSPVKTAALSFGVPILQPTDLNDSEFLSDLRALRADIFVVVAFRILPESVFTMPPLGTINLHASLLPKYRGAAPINWAIINGDTETGVSTIALVKSVDAGDLLLQRRVKITQNVTAGELHDRLATLGADLLLETVNGIGADAVHPVKQEGEVTRAPKLTKELCQIDWREDNVYVRNLVQGLSPIPGAFSYLSGKLLKFFRAELVAISTGNSNPGEVMEVDPKGGRLIIATGSGAISVTELQPEGKRRMCVHDFLLGYKVQVGECFGKP